MKRVVLTARPACHFVQSEKKPGGEDFVSPAFSVRIHRNRCPLWRASAILDPPTLFLPSDPGSPAVKAVHSSSFAASPRTLRALLVALALAWLPGAGVRADDKADPSKKPAVSALDKPAPENVADLRAIQQQVKEVLKKVVPGTVG